MFKRFSAVYWTSNFKNKVWKLLYTPNIFYNNFTEPHPLFGLQQVSMNFRGWFFFLYAYFNDIPLLCMPFCVRCLFARLLLYEIKRFVGYWQEGLHLMLQANIINWEILFAEQTLYIKKINGNTNIWLIHAIEWKFPIQTVTSLHYSFS